MTLSADRSPILKILAISVPAAFRNSLDTVQVLIGLMMVGSLGVAELAAVGLGIQFLMAVNVVMTIYIVGGNAIIARYIGGGRFHRANIAFNTIFFLSIALSLCTAVIGYNGANELYELMGASKEVSELGVEYFSILSLAMPLYFLDALFFNVLSAAAKTKASLYIKIVSTLLNAFFNYVLIFGHFGFVAMGVKGAAMATIASYLFSVIVYFILISRKNSIIKLRARLCPRHMMSVIKIGLPSAIERLIYVMSFMFFVKLIAGFSMEALAGYQIGLRIEGIAFMAGVGFSIAAMSLTGQALGEKNYTKAYNDAITISKIAAYVMAAAGVLLILFPDFFASLFTEDKLTLDHASVYLRLVGISQVPLANIFVLTGALRGAGATKITLVLNVAPLVLLRILPALYLSKFTNDVSWVYVAMTIETYVKCALFLIVFKRGNWKNKKLI